AGGSLPGHQCGSQLVRRIEDARADALTTSKWMGSGESSATILREGLLPLNSTWPNARSRNRSPRLTRMHVVLTLTSQDNSCYWVWPATVRANTVTPLLRSTVPNASPSP